MAKEQIIDLTKEKHEIYKDEFDIDQAPNDLRLQIEYDAKGVCAIVFYITEPWFAYQLGWDGQERETVEKYKQCAQKWAQKWAAKNPQLSMEWSDTNDSPHRTMDEVDSENGETMKAIVCFPQFKFRVPTTKSCITNTDALKLAKPLLDAYKDFENEAGDIMKQSRTDCVRTVLNLEPVEESPEEEEDSELSIAENTEEFLTLAINMVRTKSKHLSADYLAGVKDGVEAILNILRQRSKEEE